MSQSNDQKAEAMEKVSQVGEQLDLGGEDVSNAVDKLKNGELGVKQFASLVETVGQQAGALLGRRVGETVGQKLADEDGSLSFSSITSSLKSGGSDGESAESGSEGDDGESGDESGETEEQSEDQGGNEDEGEDGDGDESGGAEGDDSEGPGSFEDMSDDELQNLANDLMDELEQRQSSES